MVGKSILQEIATWGLSGDIKTLIWRLGDTVQNLESCRLSGRVDSTVICGYPVIHMSLFLQNRDVCTLTCFLMPLIIYCLPLIAGDGTWKRKEDVEGRVGRRKMSWVWEFWNCYAV